MAVRKNETGTSRLTRTSGFPAQNNISGSLWYWHGANSTGAIYILVSASYTTYMGLYVSTGRLIWDEGGYSSGAFGPNPMSTSTWYQIVWSKSSAGSLNIWVDGTQYVTAGAATTAPVSTPIELAMLNDSVSTPASADAVNGRIAAVKIWDGATLTAAELAQERWSFKPKRTANLWAWYPMIDSTVANCALDYSGNGRNWTVSGSSMIVEAGPPILWSQSRKRPLFPAAAGGATPINASFNDTVAFSDSIIGLEPSRILISENFG